MAEEAEEQLRAYVEYFRDLGVHDFYRRGEPVVEAAEAPAEGSKPSADAGKAPRERSSEK